MKIAICGKNDTTRENVIKSFISNWSMYASPAENVFNLERDCCGEHEKLNSVMSEMNEAEQCLFNKILLLHEQHEKYKDVDYLIYNGHIVDVLINALILCEEGYVSEKLVEKAIYYNKKLLRDIDVVYIVPDETVNEDSSEEDIKLESVYYNFYENYQNEFYTSPFFDQKNCPSIMMVDMKNPLAEMKMLIDKNGNLESSSHDDGSLIDTAMLKRALKNPELLKAAMESIDNTKEVGTTPFSGSITF